MILAMLINLDTKNIINSTYVTNIDNIYIELLNYFYNYDSSILVDPFISIDDVCSKIISIQSINSFEYNEFVEITIGIKMSKYDIFPKLIDWVYIPLPSILYEGGTYSGVIIIYENVGYTLDNFNKFTLKSFEICNVFEIMYGLFLLHKNGIVHGSMSLSNITFKEVDNTSDANVYMLDGEINTYVFLNNGLKCYIINFSNSIIRDDYDIIPEYNINLLIKKHSLNIRTKAGELFAILCLIDYIELSICLKSIFNDIQILDQLKNNAEKLIDEITTNHYLYNSDLNNEIWLFNQLFDDYLINRTDFEINRFLSTY